MPSILSNPMPEQGNNTDPIQAAKNIVEMIMNSSNPQAEFQKILDSNPFLKEKYEEMNRYASNDPRQAFINYATQNAKSSLAEQIIKNFVSKFGVG